MRNNIILNNNKKKYTSKYEYDLNWIILNEFVNVTFFKNHSQ